MHMGQLLRVLTISVATVSALSAMNAQPNLMLLAQDPSFETTISGNTLSQRAFGHRQYAEKCANGWLLSH